MHILRHTTRLRFPQRKTCFAVVAFAESQMTADVAAAGWGFRTALEAREALYPDGRLARPSSMWSFSSLPFRTYARGDYHIAQAWPSNDETYDLLADLDNLF